MEEQEALGVLEQTVLFHGLPETAREAAAVWRRLSFPRGGEIFSPRQFEPALGVVLSGRVEVTRGALRMDELGPGDIFGAAGLFGGHRFPTTLTARTPCEVALIPKAGMETLLAAHPPLSQRYIAYLSGRVAFLSDRLDALGAGRGAEKLLCYLTERGGRLEGLSYEKLAATLGLSRATLYRSLDALVERGLVEKRGKAIVCAAPLETRESKEEF